MPAIWLNETSEILSVEEMYRADAAAEAMGVPSLELMEAAGAAVAERVIANEPDGPVAILCGPGNNGGDGFVAARLLAEAGRDVRLASLGDITHLKGDAAVNAGLWRGAVAPLEPGFIGDAAIVVDAIFGAGLARPLDGRVADTVEALNDSGVACLAVDVPSGVDGNSGSVLGIAPRATETVTFFRRKPGHLLYPGRELCGNVHVADIGIPQSVCEQIAPQTMVCEWHLWRDIYPWPKLLAHKFSRGHVVVAGGDSMTGAARLASHAAQRVGAGLVTIFSPPSAAAIYRSGHAGILVRDIASDRAFAEALDDPKITSLVVGPGLGLGASTRKKVLSSLASGKQIVLDADALSVFAEEPETLFQAIATGGPTVMTPHEGEFSRLFGDDACPAASKLIRARAAANRSGAMIVLKGADSVIAAPDGRAAINDNAPPSLATAGAGDVLSGFIGGLMAQGMAPYDAASAGVWLHGAAAKSIGPGLIAEDIADALPAVLASLSKDAPG